MSKKVNRNRNVDSSVRATVVVKENDQTTKIEGILSVLLEQSLSDSTALVSNIDEIVNMVKIQKDAPFL